LRHLQQADNEIEITIIEADVSIGKEYTVGPTTELNYQLTGRGGTDFNYALKRARELKPDICFYYTDGYAPAPDPENRVPCPMVWLISPGGTPPDPHWGYILEMRDKFEGETKL
jgi:predicted metal-dependent peptidase